MIAQVTDWAESIGAVRMRSPLSRRSRLKALTAEAMLPSQIRSTAGSFRLSRRKDLAAGLVTRGTRSIASVEDKLVTDAERAHDHPPVRRGLGRGPSQRARRAQGDG